MTKFQIDFVLHVEGIMYKLFLPQLKRWSLRRKEQIHSNNTMTWMRKLRRQHFTNITATEIYDEKSVGLS